MYNEFAEIYDKLTADIDYTKYVDYLERIFKQYNTSPKLVLDLACGTGNVTVEMAMRGYDMIGVDLSVEMLNIAREKAVSSSQEILFLNQDMTDFELFGTVDAIVCALDSVNYITDKRLLKRFFKLCHNYLNPEGLLVFDINTVYKFKHVLGNNIFLNDESDIYYIWENSYNSKNRLCDFYLTFFKKSGDAYTRFDEFHTERAYEISELKEIIASLGFEYLECFSEFTFDKPKVTTQRIFFVVRKK